MSNESGHCCCCHNGGGQKSCNGGGGDSRGGSCCGRGSFFRGNAALWISFFSLVLGFLTAHFDADWRRDFPLADPSWIAVILCGFPIISSGFSALFKSGKISSSLLVGAAIIAALALEFFSEASGGGLGECGAGNIFAAGEISFLMALGGALEEFTVAKTKEGLKRLVKLSPKKALRKKGAALEEIDASQIRSGDIIVATHNEMIACDGEVVGGFCLADQSSLTGESAPVEKRVGDAVYAGTWNKSGHVEIRASSSSAETAIAKLVNLAQEADGKKAPISRIADKWASRIVPSAIALAAMVFLFSKFALGMETVSACVRGATILVVFCPCAFVLATPTAVAAAIGNSSKKGVLVKSGAAMETLSKVSRIFFDKTGTLTSAKLKVSSMISAGALPENEFLRAVASAEKFSRHPIASAIVSEAAARGITLSEPESVKADLGRGIEADFGSCKIRVCSPKALNKSEISAELEAFLSRAKNRGETVFAAFKDGEFLGAVSLFDGVKPEAAASVLALKKMGVKSSILSGDNYEAVSRVAEIVGADSFSASLMPEEKLAFIDEARAKNETVMMVGDGVNDAPSLARADVSAAMGALGSDAAIDAADISVLNDNLSLIPRTVALSKNMMLTIRFNLSVSVLINILAVFLAATGAVGPVGGALIHNASSLLVVGNSARILFRK
ncbi:MAG: cation-translocating P-type ATPase [Opitutales bacterium]|nr:cation-translocating P-type ATPase [Opitutales bacterium]